MADADGKVVYKVEMDDSDVNSQLDKVNSKIKNQSNETSEKQKKSIKDVFNIFKKKTNEAVQENKQANTNIQNDTTSLTDKLKNAFVSAFQNIGESIKENASYITDPMDDIAENVGLSFSTLTKAGIIGGILAVGTASVASAASSEEAMKKFQAQTGATNEELGSYQEIMEDIYAGNYGESFSDVADNMAKVKQQMQGISDEDLQSTTEGLLTLRDTFDMDFDETLRGTNQLMEQFGLTSEEALDLMAKGGQLGLDYTHELGDNVSEYSGKFAQAGYSAEEYFQLLKNGTKNGAYNLDKVNDAINEVTTRLADGTIEENLGMFSSETQNVFKAWQNGQATQKDVIDSIVGDIQNCTNEQEKMTLAATAFGTMGEDANTQFVESLSSVGNEFENVEGTMDGVKETMSSGLFAQFEELKRSVEMLLQPLGELLIPLLSTFIGILADIIGVIAQVVQAVFDWVANWQENIAVLQELFSAFGTWFSELITGIATWFTEKWQEVTTFFSELWTNVITWFQNKWDETVTWFSNLLDSISNFFQDVWNGISTFFQNVLTGISNTFKNLWSGMVNTAIGILNGFKSTVTSIVEAIKGVFNGIVSFLTGVFTGNWRQAWNGIKSIFSSIVGGFSGIFKAPINAIISGINTFISGLNKIKIPSWVPGVGGLGFNLPKIPRLKVGMDFVPSDFYPAYLDYGEAVLTKEQNAKLRSWGGIENIEQMLSVMPFSGVDSEIDYEKLAQAMANVNIPVYMDAKMVGYSVTGAVDQNMGIITSRKGRYGI